MARHSLVKSLFGRDVAMSDPFSSLQSEIDRVFEQFRQNPFSTALDTGSAGNGRQLVMPRTDISETDQSLDVEVELPGVKLEDVDVSVVDEMLVIRGTKKTESERKDKNYHVIERSSGEFSRRIPLGFDVEADKVKASFRDGVLSVQVTKPADAKSKARKIEVRPAEKA